MNLILYMTGLLFMLTFFATFLTISSSNPVYAVLGLICLFTFTSCYLILLGLGFIGISYLLIYVGAIAILFLFVVMMMNLKFLTYHLLPNFLPLATVITIFFFFSNFSFFFLFDSFNFFFFSPLNYPWSCLFNSSHHLTSLAYPLYSSFSLWLLFSSLLLLLAMIAPIILILPSSQHSLPNSSCHTSIPASSSHLSTPMKTSVRSFHSQHLSNKIARDLHCHRKGGSPDTSLFYKELMIIEWKIFLIKILIIFSLYIISLLPVDIIIVCFCYAKTIIIGDLIMCAEIPGSEEPLDVDHANTYESMSNNEIKQTVRTVTDTCNNESLNKDELHKDLTNISSNVKLIPTTIATAATAKGISYYMKGNMKSSIASGAIAATATFTNILIGVAEDELHRKIDNLSDNHTVNDNISPSAYDDMPNISSNSIPDSNNIAYDISTEEPLNHTESDNQCGDISSISDSNNIADDISTEKTTNLTESDNQCEDIINNSVSYANHHSDDLPSLDNLFISTDNSSQLTDNLNNDILKESILPPFDSIINGISQLDNGNKLIICIIIFFISPIVLYYIKLYQNKSNNYINELPYNNKYFNYWKKYKNFLNKYANIFYNLFIIYNILMLLLSILLYIYISL